MNSMNKIFLLLLVPFFCFANSIGKDNNSFALALFSEWEDREENLAFSPYGIFSNLSLLFYGAEGTTAQEIKHALHLSADGDKFLTAFQKLGKGFSKKTEFGYELSIANALFPHQDTIFLTRFKEIAIENFGAKLQSVDYALPDSTLETINNWVSEKTKGKIEEIVSEQDIDRSTRLIVANAVYFEGKWVHPFAANKGMFYLSTREGKEVPMLHQLQTLPYYETEDIQCLALPFVRQGTEQPFLECLLLLPKEKTLSQIEKTLTPKQIDAFLSQLKPTGVSAQIPKFCFSKKLLLNDPLKKLGMKEAFTFQADFSRIDGRQDLYLNKVLHETFFSFHENGVTAASATTSNMGTTSFPPAIEEAKDFIADRPFLFFIVDFHSRAILFMGRVTDPTLGKDCHEN